MSAPVQTPDAQQLRAESLANAPFPGQSGDIRVYFEQSVHDAIAAHAGENTTVEICGVLVGGWKQDEGGPYVHISASIRGDAAASKFAEVTFTHETWAKINERMDKEFATSAIVGWYHTHPDFGVFLSDRDVFIHQHFFSAPGQIALVVDPVRHEEGVFVWRRGKPKLAPAHWVGTGQRWSPRTTAPGVPERESVRGEGAVAAAAPVVQTPASWSNSVLVAAAAMGVFAAGYLIARYGENQNRLLIASALAEQLYNRTSSPETRQSLRTIRGILADIGDESRKLTEPKKEGVEAPSPERIAASIREGIGRAGVEIDRTIEAQTLRPEQQAALNAILNEQLQVVTEMKIQELINRGVLSVTKPPEPAGASAGASGAATPAGQPGAKAEPAKGGK